MEVLTLESMDGLAVAVTWTVAMLIVESVKGGAVATTTEVNVLILELGNWVAVTTLVAVEDNCVADADAEAVTVAVAAKALALEATMEEPTAVVVWTVVARADDSVSGAATVPDVVVTLEGIAEPIVVVR